MSNKIYKDEDIFRILEESLNFFIKHNVKRIGIFGSFSRNEQKEDSDLDLIIDFDLDKFGHDFNGLYDSYSEIKDYLESKINRKVDLLTPSSISSHLKNYIDNELKWYEIRLTIH